MKNVMKLSMVSLVASVLLIGCGSSSSSSSDSDLKTGQFIDAPVANCEYRTSSGKKGKTNRDGKFQYRQGDTVKFSLGGLTLGEAKPEASGLITPKTLAGSDDKTVTTLLRILQALDSDNNPENGIHISDEVLASLQKINTEVTASSFANDGDFLASVAVDEVLKKALDEDGNNLIDVGASKAHEHFKSSLQKWRKENPSDREDAHAKGKGHGGKEVAKQDGNKGSEEVDKGTTMPTPSIPGTFTLSKEVRNSLAYMGNEERLAYDIYTTLYDVHMERGEEIKQLKNIPNNSEIKHIAKVRELIQKYNIDITTVQNVDNPVANKDVAFEDMPKGKYDVKEIQELYNTLFDKGITSKQAALEVGCMVEVVDVDDLDKYIIQAQSSNASDVVEAYEFLRKGSYNHYWAFDKTLKKMGVSEGCGVLGSAYVKDYPQNEEDNHKHEE